MCVCVSMSVLPCLLYPPIPPLSDQRCCSWVLPSASFHLYTVKQETCTVSVRVCVCGGAKGGGVVVCMCAWVRESDRENEESPEVVGQGEPGYSHC